VTGEQLAAWRAHFKWSKYRAAKELGLSYNGYQAYESGKRPIPLHVALACRALEWGLKPA
jgi:predicted transcriptional regulator